MARFIEDRSSDTLFLQGSLESLLPSTSCARSLWRALESFDFGPFEAVYKNDETGRPAVAPRALAGVVILGLLRGIDTSLGLARCCAQDIEFRWLLGDAPVKKGTLCEFRTAHVEALSQLSAQVLAALGRSGQLPGKDLVLDGTIVRAAASCAASVSRAGLQKKIARLKEMAAQRLTENDPHPEAESAVLARRAQRLEQCLGEMDRMGLLDDKARLTTTEPEASLKRLKNGGFAPAYNVQVVCDAQSGAIITTTVIDKACDQGELLAHYAAQQVLDDAAALRKTEVAVPQSITADGAYHCTGHLTALAAQGTQPVVPSRPDDRRPPWVAEEFARAAFIHNPATNTLRCPMGQTLTYHGKSLDKNSAVYRAPAKTCNACPAHDRCCPKSKSGRRVKRSLHADALQQMQTFVQSDQGKRHRRARAVTSEGTMARLKHHLHWQRCRTWGKAAAQAQALWRQITHNIQLLSGQWKPLVLVPSNL